MSNRITNITIAEAYSVLTTNDRRGCQCTCSCGIASR